MGLGCATAAKFVGTCPDHSSNFIIPSEARQTNNRKTADRQVQSRLLLGLLYFFALCSACFKYKSHPLDMRTPILNSETVPSPTLYRLVKVSASQFVFLLFVRGSDLVASSSCLKNEFSMRFNFRFKFWYVQPTHRQHDTCLWRVD